MSAVGTMELLPIDFMSIMPMPRTVPEVTGRWCPGPGPGRTFTSTAHLATSGAKQATMNLVAQPLQHDGESPLPPHALSANQERGVRSPGQTTKARRPT